MVTAVYPGSLDPITFGHVGAIRDTAGGFDKVIVAVGVNPAKNYLFSLAEREALARHAVAGIEGVSVSSFSGLLVHYLIRNNLDVVVRGLRNGQDLDDALLQETVGWQQAMAKNIKAFYVPARTGRAFISSGALKAVLKEQGDATHLAPLSSIHATQARMLSQYFFGLTGVSGAGKSYLSRKFSQIAGQRGIPLFHIDLDEIGHAVLEDAQDPLYQKTRNEIEQAFGAGMTGAKGTVVRKRLGEIVFRVPDRLKRLNEILREPVFFRVNDLLRGRRGIFLIDSALLVETNKTSFVNNHLFLIDAGRDKIAERLQLRDNLSAEQIERRVASQYSASAKLAAVNSSIKAANYGGVERVDTENLSDAEVERLFDRMLKHIDIFGELRIVAFFKKLGVADPESAYLAVRACYSGNDRFYHSLSHIVDGLNKLADFSANVENLDAFVLAWLFHDAVYDSRNKDNEERSAELLGATSEAWGIDPDLIARAKRLVLTTKHGVVPPASFDEKLLVDLDMSIFADAVDDYALYESNVRREYNWASAAEWTAGRGAFLASLRAPYFHTPYFVDRMAKLAERNIADSLARLTK